MQAAMLILKRLRLRDIGRRQPGAMRHHRHPGLELTHIPNRRDMRAAAQRAGLQQQTGERVESVWRYT